jgi:hypothetical protein
MFCNKFKRFGPLLFAIEFAVETAGMGQQQQTSMFLERLPKGVYFVYGEIEKYEGGKQVMTVVAMGL